MRRKRRRRRELIHVIVFTITSMSLLLCILLLNFEKKENKSSVFSYQNSFNEWLMSLSPKKTEPSNQVKTKFKKGEQVIWDNPKETNSTLKKVGTVIEIEKKLIKGHVHTSYIVNFSQKNQAEKIEQKYLKKINSKYKIGQKIELISPIVGISGTGKITEIFYNNESPYGITYEADFSVGGKVTSISDSEISVVYNVPLKIDNTAAENDIILQRAIDFSKNHQHTILNFPKGHFQIGDQDAKNSYLVLASNIELRGNETSLIVNKGAYWYGFATGPNASDGVSNFTMTNLEFKAKNLQEGSSFIIIANHGENWNINQNSFVMVHKMGSHIFDLGGLQDVTFSNNRFIGYAPELAKTLEIGDREYHDFYSEAIQLDVSDASVPWEGDFLKDIEPHYETNGATRLISHNITITNNQFLPYISDDGTLVAYGATIGQHSSEVGMTTIYGNIFSNTLTKRLTPNYENEFNFKPIHIQSRYPIQIYGNIE